MIFSIDLIEGTVLFFSQLKRVKTSTPSRCANSFWRIPRFIRLARM